MILFYNIVSSNYYIVEYRGCNHFTQSTNSKRKSILTEHKKKEKEAAKMGKALLSQTMYVLSLLLQNSRVCVENI